MAITIFKKGKRKYTITVGIILLIIVVLVVRARTSGSAALQFATATVGDVTETVSVTGQVVPVDKADLAFQKSGVLAVRNVAVGDQVKTGDVLAALNSATDRAALTSAQAKLSDMTRGLRPEEYAADQAQVLSAQVALTNATQAAINTYNEAFVTAQSSLNNYADKLFSNPQSVNPTLNVPTQSQQIQVSINQDRLNASGELLQWQTEINAMNGSASSSSSVSTLLNRSSQHLAVIKSFLLHLTSIVNVLSPSGSSLSQPLIDSYVAAVNSASAGVNSGITSITTASNTLANATSALSSANSQFTLSNAGSSKDAIAAQSAQVALYQATLNQDTLAAPIDGIVSRADPKVGEFVQAGQVSFGVINKGVFKIEAFVPEADIAKIVASDTASVTLDAYGSDTTFKAHVVSIDPSETVLQGVPTYKVTLYFDQPDSRILSGMTANTDILTHQVHNVINIPYRAVVTSNGVKNVKLLNTNGSTYKTVPVKVGLRGSDGTIEILSGVAAGDKVVVDTKI